MLHKFIYDTISLHDMQVLRMMLHKKIYPKSSSQMASLKRFIKEKEMRDKREMKIKREQS